MIRSRQKISTSIFLFLLLISSICFGKSQLPNFADLVEKVGPSVVKVDVTMEAERQRIMSIDEFFFGRRHPRPQQEPEFEQRQGFGSGFVIDADEGLILTNHHVVDEADTIKVTLKNGKAYEAELIGQDNGTDVALLKIDAKGLQELQLGSVEKLRVGSWVLAVGMPFGLEHSASAGIVSAKRRNLRGNERYVPFIQTDVAVNPGNSGGPLVSTDGKVVGINSRIYSGTGGYMGISFAIPIDVAMKVVEQLKKHGEVRRGFLGVGFQTVDADIAEAYGLDEVKGALVTELSEDGPAKEAGIKVQDIIIEVDGEKVAKADDLPFIIGSLSPDDKIAVKVVRQGKIKVIKVKLDLYEGNPVDDRSLAGSKNKGRLGVAVATIPEKLQESYGHEGVMVRKIVKGPAWRAGIRKSDVILAINRQPIESVEQFANLVKALPTGKKIPILIVRSNARGETFQRVVTLTLDE